MPYLCLLQESCPNLPRLIEKANQNLFNVVAAPINPMTVPLEFQEEPMCNQINNLTYPDILLNGEQWSSKFISILSDEIECDSSDSQIRRQSEEVILRDLSWVSHIQYNGYTMLRLRCRRNHNLARIAAGKIKGHLLVQVPLYNRKLAQSQWRQDVDENDLAQYEEEDTWNWWNDFRCAADYNTKLRVVCELNECNVPNDDIIRRWLGEPLEAIIIPGTMFLINRSNYPVLPKVWKNIIVRFIRARVNIILACCEDDNLKYKAEYIEHLKEQHLDNHQLQAYEDMLEIPLQPLYDNLDCFTYEIFEKDPVKYKLYQRAVEAALIDRVPVAEVETKTTIVMVLGAGRGPLVRSCLNAAENTQRKIRIYVIEKNPNAIRTLTNMGKKLWHNKDVHIFSKDMREFKPPEKADIIVSELLGSFGDNELSPECLDSSLELLKPDGISIPSKSISYINPIMSSKLFNAVRQITRHDHFGRDKQATYLTHAESGFVVLLKNIYNIGQPKALFEFVHPNYDKPIDNSRFKVLQFEVILDCVLNGIAGYFEAILYKDIMLSINPETHTPGMVSWFPMYFPFADPIHLKKGQTIEIQFWRCVTKQKIWYEWCLTEPVTTHIHNQNGRSCPIYCS